MNLSEAEQAMKSQTPVFHKDEPENTGIITCFSDCKTSVYYKPYLREKRNPIPPYWWRGCWNVEDIRTT